MTHSRTSLLLPFPRRRAFVAVLSFALAAGLALGSVACAAPMPTPSPSPSPPSTATPSPSPSPSPTPSPATDLTPRTVLTASSGANLLALAHDGDLATWWKASALAAQTFDLALPAGAGAKVLSLQWRTIPAAFRILWKTGASDWTTLATGTGQDLLDARYDIPGGCTALRIEADDLDGRFQISEIGVFTAGVLPSTVRNWQLPDGKADLLVVAAHPDDELLYMGGTIPTYAGQEGKRIVVVYMTFGQQLRRREAIDGLWSVGDTVYPVFGPFKDKLVMSLAAARTVWGDEQVLAFLVEQLRRFKPEVVVSHDLNGEYGHGAHRLTATDLLRAIPLAADPAQFPDSAAKYGTWSVRKCYLHLATTRPIVMDWNVPLSVFSGRTALDMAKLGYAFHVSQHQYSYQVLDSGPYNCAKFGLVYSSVGDDVVGGDFFENIPTEAATPSP